MRLGVFGGTFNPIHYGHLRAAEEVCDAERLDKVILVPSGNPPFKTDNLAPASDRLQMAKLAASGNPRLEVSGMETERPEEKSYTVNTLLALKRMRPGDEIFFILGMDAFLDMPNWYRPDLLVNMAEFAIIRRPGMRFMDLLTSPLLGLSKDDLAGLDSGAVNTLRTKIKGGRAASLMNITPLDISATLIRAMLKDGRSVKYLLPENVESFIMSHKLYSA